MGQDVRAGGTSGVYSEKTFSLPLPDLAFLPGRTNVPGFLRSSQEHSGLQTSWPSSPLCGGWFTTRSCSQKALLEGERRGGNIASSLNVRWTGECFGHVYPAGTTTPPSPWEGRVALWAGPKDGRPLLKEAALLLLLRLGRELGLPLSSGSSVLLSLLCRQPGLWSCLTPLLLAPSLSLKERAAYEKVPHPRQGH